MFIKILQYKKQINLIHRKSVFVQKIRFLYKLNSFPLALQINKNDLMVEVFICILYRYMFVSFRNNTHLQQQKITKKKEMIIFSVVYYCCLNICITLFLAYILGRYSNMYFIRSFQTLFYYIIM